jgi:hypothetical protein
VKAQPQQQCVTYHFWELFFPFCPNFGIIIRCVVGWGIFILHSVPDGFGLDLKDVADLVDRPPIGVSDSTDGTTFSVEVAGVTGPVKKASQHCASVLE